MGLEVIGWSVRRSAAECTLRMGAVSLRWGDGRGQTIGTYVPTEWSQSSVNDKLTSRRRREACPWTAPNGHHSIGWKCHATELPKASSLRPWAKGSTDEVMALSKYMPNMLRNVWRQCPWQSETSLFAMTSSNRTLHPLPLQDFSQSLGTIKSALWLSIDLCSLLLTTELMYQLSDLEIPTEKWWDFAFAQEVLHVFVFQGVFPNKQRPILSWPQACYGFWVIHSQAD